MLIFKVIYFHIKLTITKKNTYFQIKNAEYKRIKGNGRRNILTSLKDDH